MVFAYRLGHSPVIPATCLQWLYSKVKDDIEGENEIENKKIGKVIVIRLEIIYI